MFFLIKRGGNKDSMQPQNSTHIFQVRYMDKIVLSYFMTEYMSTLN